MTPTQAAREWAKQNPDAIGIIEIEYLAPNGKWGRRGFSKKSTICYVKNGQAAQTRGKNYNDPETGERLHGFNGYCHICRQIFLEPILMTGHLPDPEAGQPIQEPNSIAHRVGSVRNSMAWVNACPDCFERLGLDEKTNGTMGSSWTNPPVDWARLHPAYMVGDRFTPAPLTILNLSEAKP